MSKRKSVRLSCTSTPQVSDAVDILLWSGMWGNSRSAVVERLLCHAILDVLDGEAIAAIADLVKNDTDKTGMQ